ncbi:beta-ketoacyl synthase chain length factor [Wenzhouxiangella marina]|uniref:Beta-ketoacyl synthase-like N-terminal domain-containing protein n=1 Tax=Wenzhouxiangella marina TaxID=1579979 RepID=A0A0K0Y090_9GAMM|nr:beta-ketoacyl synthase chain length factor [Wenzhouxiangella marina]AKS43354.1 hypothetical protein WM2015_3001 [Wenzhouxiangella marina]MBB6088531.1 hypothetical protein [Wenzhouxiangella marina]
MSHRIDILGLGLAAPGLRDRASLQAALAGRPLETNDKPSTSSLLSPRERRRAPAAVKLSFPAAEQACAMAGLEPGEPLAIFSSGMGDLDITDYMCRTLAEAPELLSPTRFHNSVHNAASGYWSIGAGATGDVTALSAWRDSAALGLLEGMTRCLTDARPVLVVVYDDRAVGPMRDLWPSEHAFCAALVLAPAGHGGAIATLQIDACREAARHPALPEALEARIEDNPAARLLPVLALIEGAIDGEVVLAAERGPSLRVRRSA